MLTVKCKRIIYLNFLLKYCMRTKTVIVHRDEKMIELKHHQNLLQPFHPQVHVCIIVAHLYFISWNCIGERGEGGYYQRGQGGVGLIFNFLTRVIDL